MGKPDYMKYDGRTSEPPYDTEAATSSCTVDSIVGLDDCLAEINNALNFWYPLESEGCEKTECDARHVRLFRFRDRLAKQLKPNKAISKPEH